MFYAAGLLAAGAKFRTDDNGYLLLAPALFTTSSRSTSVHQVILLLECGPRATEFITTAVILSRLLWNKFAGRHHEPSSTNAAAHQVPVRISTYVVWAHPACLTNVGSEEGGRFFSRGVQESTRHPTPKSRNLNHQSVDS